MWAIVSNRKEKLELIINKAASKCFDENKEDESTHFEPLKYYIRAAVMARKCIDLCEEVCLTGVQDRYKELANEYEDKSVDLITEIGRDTQYTQKRIFKKQKL